MDYKFISSSGLMVGDVMSRIVMSVCVCVMGE